MASSSHNRAMIAATRHFASEASRVEEMGQRLINDIASGCSKTLVLGAGFSRVATGTDWSNLIDVIGARLQADNKRLPKNWKSMSFPDRAEYFLQRYRGCDESCRLEGLVLHSVQIKPRYRVGPVEKAILSLPVKYIVTTNYDVLIEKTLDLLRIPYTVIADEGQLNGHPPKPPKGGVLVIKMHGDEEARGVVIAQSDFKNYCKVRPKMARYVASILGKKPILYGLSLHDPNLGKLLKTYRATKKVKGHVFGSLFTAYQQNFAHRRGLVTHEYRDIDAMKAGITEIARCAITNGKIVAARRRTHRTLAAANLRRARSAVKAPQKIKQLKNAFKFLAMDVAIGREVPANLLLNFARIFAAQKNRDPALIRLAYELAIKVGIPVRRLTVVDLANLVAVYAELKDYRAVFRSYNSLIKKAQQTRLRDKVQSALLGDATCNYLLIRREILAELTSQKRYRAGEIFAVNTLATVADVICQIRSHHNATEAVIDFTATFESLVGPLSVKVIKYVKSKNKALKRGILRGNRRLVSATVRSLYSKFKA